MEHLEDAPFCHQLEQRRQVDPRRQRIDRYRFLGTGYLDEAENRPIGALAHELGVDRNKARTRLSRTEARQRVGFGNHRHWLSYTPETQSPEPLRFARATIRSHFRVPLESVPLGGVVQCQSMVQQT